MATSSIIRPRTLNLQAIDVCNSRCIMCNIWRDGRREQMSIAQLRDFLQQPFFSEVWHVGVTGGEPTLRRDLFELYRLLPECLPKLAGASFITHGMQTERAVELYARVHEHYRARQLTFEGMVSLDGVGAVHDRIRGRKGAFASAAQTLRTLKQRGVPVIAACTIVRSNVYDLHDLVDWGKEHGIYVRFRVAEFIRRLYNDDCAAQIRCFSARELRHLISFLHLLLTDYETDETIRKTYRSVLSLLTGGERLTGCPYRSGVAVNVDSRGALASCAPKGAAFEMTADAEWVHGKLEAQREAVARQHCANCIHDYHDDWSTSARHAEERAAARGRELYGLSEAALTTAELPAETLNLAAMQQILLAGWYGTETAGDIAILQGIITEYLAVNPGLQFRVLSLHPSYTRNTIADWPDVLRARVQIMDYASEAAWQATVECDALIMAGGPLMDIGETAKILCLFQRFASLGKPRVIEGCGIGPLHRPDYRWNVCRIARLATRITVRDQASREMLRTFGICKPIEVRLDPAVTFIRAQGLRHHGSDTKVIRGFLRELTSEYPQAITAEQATGNLTTLLRNLLEWYPDHRIELWAMHHFPVGGDDRLFARRLVRQIGNPRLTVDFEPRSPREILEAMAAAALCVCMRFHSNVFAAEIGAPFLAIDYTAGGKIKGFLEDSGQERRLATLKDLAALDRETFETKVRCQPTLAADTRRELGPQRPRVLHVIQGVSGGGGARAMISLAKYSRRLGGPEHRIVSLLPAERAGLLLAQQAEVEVIDHPGRNQLRRELADADIVLVHWWNVPELASLFRAELPPMRLALWLHVGGYHSPQVLTPALIDFADLAVACSPHTHEHPAFPARPEASGELRHAMVLAGADFERLDGVTPQPHEGFRVGYIGTLDPVKMHSEFVAMSCAVQVPEVKFVVCGGGDVRWLTGPVEELGRAASFEFRGAVEDIRSVIETLDVYGYPLCAETYAAAELNLQEVMFAGVPVVAFPHGGIARLIRHNETGLLVNTPHDYARAIEHLHRNPAERARLGANAAALARTQWGAENAAREFNRHFERLLTRVKRERTWEEGSMAGPMPTLPRELAIHPGTRLFIASLADGAQPFRESLMATRLEDAIRSEEKIAALSRLMHFAGVQAYRNAHPTDPFLQLWTGLGMLQTGQAAAALGCFEWARRVGFPDLRIHWYRALAADRAQRPAQAAAALKDLLQLAPGFAPAREMQRRLTGSSGAPASGLSAQQCLQLGVRLLQQGRLEEARLPLARALELMPDQVPLMEALGELECRLGQFESARKHHDEILRREPRRKSPTLRAMQVALGAQAKTLQPA